MSPLFYSNSIQVISVNRISDLTCLGSAFQKNYSSLPFIHGGYILKHLWMPEVVNRTELYIYYVFLTYTYLFT